MWNLSHKASAMLQVLFLVVNVYSARLDQLSRPIRSPETLKLIS